MVVEAGGVAAEVAVAIVAEVAAVTADRRTAADRIAKSVRTKTEAGEHPSPASLRLCGNVDAVF
jgi:hypothetical protein